MNWLLAHPFQTIAAYWVFSAFISGMPEPAPTASVAYIWAYKSFHMIAGDVASAMQARYSNLLPPSQIPNNGK